MANDDRSIVDQLGYMVRLSRAKLKFKNMCPPRPQESGGRHQAAADHLLPPSPAPEIKEKSRPRTPSGGSTRSNGIASGAHYGVDSESDLEDVRFESCVF